MVVGPVFFANTPATATATAAANANESGGGRGDGKRGRKKAQPAAVVAEDTELPPAAAQEDTRRGPKGEARKRKEVKEVREVNQADIATQRLRSLLTPAGLVVPDEDELRDAPSARTTRQGRGGRTNRSVAAVEDEPLSSPATEDDNRGLQPPSNKKAFPCDQCAKSFGSSRGLVDHKFDAHNAEKPARDTVTDESPAYTAVAAPSAASKWEDEETDAAVGSAQRGDREQLGRARKQRRGSGGQGVRAKAGGRDEERGTSASATASASADQFAAKSLLNFLGGMR